MAAASIPVKNVRIRALELFRYSPNGWDNAVLKKGEEINVRPLVAQCGVESGKAEIIDSEPAEDTEDTEDQNPEGPKIKSLKKKK